MKANIILIYILPFLVNASVEMDFAQQLNSKYGTSNLNTNNIPHFKGDNVEEKKYFEQRSDLRFEGNKKAIQDENGKFIIESSDKRPHFNIDQDDPMLKNMHTLTKNSHELTEDFKGCRNIKNQSEQKEEKQFCFEYGERNNVFYNCTNTLKVSCINADAGMEAPYLVKNFSFSGHYPTSISGNGITSNFGTISNHRGGRCQDHHNQVTFNIGDIKQIKDFIITSIQYDDWASININGHMVFNDSYPKRRFFISCERSINFQRGPINIKKYLKNGLNTIKTKNTVYGGGHLWFSIKASFYKKCEARDEWSRVCDENESDVFGNRIKNICLDGPASKLIKRTPVFKACWDYQEKYSKRGPKKYTLDSMCKKLIDGGCGEVSKKCLLPEKDYCKKWKVGYICSKEKVNVSICAKELPCPNGDCTKDHPNRTPRDASQDFKKSLSYFTLLKEVTDQIDTKNPKIFTGKALKCKKQNLGVKNCCKEGGWGLDLGLAKCSAQEKELGIARRNKKTIYIGRYKPKGNIFYRPKYHVFCSYPSKIARIFIREGKKQLSQNYGSPKHPNCSGIHINDLNKIDFNKVDLSELHQDMEKIAKDYKPLNLKKYINSIKNKIEKQTRKTK